jgi:hypothetical protein
MMISDMARIYPRVHELDPDHPVLHTRTPAHTRRSLSLLISAIK